MPLDRNYVQNLPYYNGVADIPNGTAIQNLPDCNFVKKPPKIFIVFEIAQFVMLLKKPPKQ